MNRRTNTAINWVVGFVVGYLVASRFADRGGALRAALLSGTITAAIAWIGYEKPAVVEALESGESVEGNAT